MVKLLTILQQVRQIFQENNIENASLDAKILVEWATNTTKKDAILTPERVISQSELEIIHMAVEKRLKAMPIYRIIGQREFYGLNFALSKDTLEPRQDTEILVDALVAILQDIVQQNGKAHFLDMGTGTGAIAIAALKQIAKSSAVGVDIAKGAVEMAKINADKNNVSSRFTLCESDWFSNVTGTFDVIVSNPPYIKADSIKNLSKEVRLHDPIRALDGGEDGLDFYRKLAQESADFLNANGYLLVEIGQGQEQDVHNIFTNEKYQPILQHRDLSGIIRVLVFKKLS